MAGEDAASVIGAIWQVGHGTVIESSKDFYSWANPDERLEVTRARMEAAWAIGALRELLGRAGTRPGPRPFPRQSTRCPPAPGVPGFVV